MPALPKFSHLQPATTLAGADDTLDPKPLSTPEEIQAFYSQQYRQARGSDRIGHLGVRLKRSYNRQLLHGFVTGHPGVGKSTEIRRLLLEHTDRFYPVHISAALEMFPGEFRIHDLLWLMTLRILEIARSPAVSGFSDELPTALLEAVRNELSQRWVETLGLTSKEVEGGLDLNLIARIRATLKLSRQRTEKTAEYTFSALSDLIEVVNRVFDESNNLLRREKQQEWILVIEDFEKLGIDPEQLRRLFIDNALLLEQLRVHLLLVIPVGLAYVEQAERMPFGRDSQFMIPDIAVMTKNHEINDPGIDALLEVTFRRVSESLLDRTLAREIAIASGGNIRDLFYLLRRAALSADVRSGSAILREDAAEAVNALRQDYAGRLGENPFDETSTISLEAKLEKLEAIFKGDPQAQIPDKVLYLLLRQRIVLQFNGEGWYAVHPLIVDRLKELNRSIKPHSPGGTSFHGK